jgi:hypothetical protein
MIVIQKSDSTEHRNIEPIQFYEKVAVTIKDTIFNTVFCIRNHFKHG